MSVELMGWDKLCRV